MMITPLGGDSPKAWRHAHSTAISNPHHATAPSRYTSRERTSSIAVRTPAAAAAGAVASRAAALPILPEPFVHRLTSRSKSPGSSETARNTTIADAPKIAGTTVSANEPPPGINPV